MNCDTVRWCTESQHIQPKAGFRPLPGVVPRREVCESCYAKIMAARERVKAKA